MQPAHLKVVNKWKNKKERQQCGYCMLIWSIEIRTDLQKKNM